MNYVIIGGSAAAIACIEAIRSSDREGAITLISSEKQPLYGRPTISYCLMGRISRENMHYRAQSFYRDNGVTALLGKTVSSIDARKKTVVIDGGKEIAYDKLLVAVGSRPFVPPADGLDGVKNVFTFMSRDDMDALDKVISAEKDVLVIGAGLIGLKCVEGILDRVKSVTVVDLADRILPSVLDAEGAAIMAKELTSRGVKLVLGDRAVSFTENTARLASGKTIKFDILVTAAGVRPNVELVREAGGNVNRGITVGEDMATSLPDVYAAGDCAEGYDASTGERRVLAILPNACFQGRTAGINMAGGRAKLFNAVAMNAMGLFGTLVLSAGIYEGECFSEAGDKGYKKLFVKDGMLVGFIMIGDIRRAGIYTSLIRGRIPLDEVDFDLLKKEPQLMAFSKEARWYKLAYRV